jgi:nitric oxide reductase activation protein
VASRRTLLLRKFFSNGDSMKSKLNMPHVWKRVGCITTVLLLLSVASLAQLKNEQQQPNPTQPSYEGQTPANRSEDVWEQQQKKAMEKKANAQRQQDIRKDTEKLLELATELKQAVDKSNKDTLSLDVVKKADEIEKLAKQVKNKMKGD